MFKNLNVEVLGVSGRPSEIIELALSNGFKGLDLNLVDFAAQVQAYGLPHARRVFDSARLKWGSFPLTLDWDLDPLGFKKELDTQAGLFELAQKLGCTRAWTTVQPASDQRPYHENFDTHRRRYVELGEVLAGYGIRLGIGLSTDLKQRAGRAFQFIQGVDAFLMLLKSIDSANVGLALDLWHWEVGGGTLDQIRSMAERVVTLSLADVDPGTTAANADENTRACPKRPARSTRPRCWACWPRPGTTDRSRWCPRSRCSRAWVARRSSSKRPRRWTKSGKPPASERGLAWLAGRSSICAGGCCQEPALAQLERRPNCSITIAD